MLISVMQPLQVVVVNYSDRLFDFFELRTDWNLSILPEALQFLGGVGPVF